MESFSNGGRRIGRNNFENEGVSGWNKVDEAGEVHKRRVVPEWTRSSDGEQGTFISRILPENEVQLSDNESAH